MKLSLTGRSRHVRIQHISAILLASITTAVAFAQPAEPFELTPCRTGCQSLVLPDGNQLLAFGANTPNNDSLRLVDQRGDQLVPPFIAGLPSGRTADGSNYGPTAYLLDNKTLYIAIGENDAFHESGPTRIFRTQPLSFQPLVENERFPGTRPIRNGPGSPARFDAVILRVVLSDDPGSSGPFRLQAEQSEQLLQGHAVVLTDFANHTATFSNLGSLGLGTRPSGVAILRDVPGTVYVADTGMSRLLSLDANGSVSVVAPFPVPPESVHAFGSAALLVSFFNPAPNTSSVWLLNPTQNRARKVTDSVTAAVDAVASTTPSAFFVLENKVDAQGLGAVLRIDAAGATTVVASSLNDPVSLATDEAAGRLYVYSRGDGVIYTVPLQ